MASFRDGPEKWGQAFVVARKVERGEDSREDQTVGKLQVRTNFQKGHLASKRKQLVLNLVTYRFSALMLTFQLYLPKSGEGEGHIPLCLPAPTVLIIIT